MHTITREYLYGQILLGCKTKTKRTCSLALFLCICIRQIFAKYAYQISEDMYLGPKKQNKQKHETMKKKRNSVNKIYIFFKPAEEP